MEINSMMIMIKTKFLDEITYTVRFFFNTTAKEISKTKILKHSSYSVRTVRSLESNSGSRSG